MHIDIPQIAVIGSQSSGKSSLFEGISGVSYISLFFFSSSFSPSTLWCQLSILGSSPTGHRYMYSVFDFVLCYKTRDWWLYRCPIVCRMSSRPGPWCCRIFIVREADPNGQLSKRIPFGPDILDVEDVCERIMRAQAAVLQPEIDPNQFLGSNRAEGEEGGFSDDSILVEIEGPDVTDLSFVDLPGKYLRQTPYVIHHLIPPTYRHHCWWQRSRKYRTSPKVGVKIHQKWFMFDSLVISLQ